MNAGLRYLKLGHRMALIGLLGLVAALLPLTQAVLGQNESLRTAEHALSRQPGGKPDALLQARIQAETARRNGLIGVTLALLGVGATLGLATVRATTRPLQRAVRLADEVAYSAAAGDLALDGGSPPAGRNGEPAQLLAALARMQQRLAERDERSARALADHRRTRLALDCCGASVLVADTAGTVIHLNHAAQRLFRQLEAELREGLAGFDAGSLIGKPLATLHPNPIEQRAVLDGLRGEHHAELRIGTLTFATALSPIVDEADERLGTVMVWQDCSAERAARTHEHRVASQLAARAQQNADDTRATGHRATQAAAHAQEGSAAVALAVEAMNRIATQVSDMDELAHQTHLQALNADIEAARAGEHGQALERVAAEVCRLSARSQVAAQELGQITGHGLQLVEKASQLIGTLVPSILAIHEAPSETAGRPDA